VLGVGWAAPCSLYDSDRCPYCARARIVLAEKDVEYETVMIDLSNRPDWLYEKNPLGKVPVLEEDSFVLPESEVIMEYLEERYPEPALLPADPAARAQVRLAIHRFDTNLGDAYYAFRRGEDRAEDRLAHCLSGMERGLVEWPLEYGLADTLTPLVDPPSTCSASTCRYPALEERLGERLNGPRSPPSSCRRRIVEMNIVFLHALPFDGRMWAPQVEAFDHETSAPTLYGLGSSFDDWALGCLQTVPGRFVAVGASMGGYTACAIARLAPERLAGLACSSARARTPTRQSARRSARNGSGSRRRTEAGASWQAAAKNFFAPGRRTKWSRRRTGSPSSSSRTTWSARLRPSATGPIDRGGDEWAAAARRGRRCRPADPARRL
jgi:pimeloyl-ACP methyl ester carboxylesterase/glutaredoxin